MLGNFASNYGYNDKYFLKAQKVRTVIKEEFDHAFTKCDIIAGPTTPITAFKIGDKSNDALAMYLNDIYTIPASLAGLPAISIPCGLDSVQMPVGLQLIAPAFREDHLLKAAHCYERFTNFGGVKNGL